MSKLNKNTTANAIRQQFLAFFAKKNHVIVPSSSLVPANDKSLLFTNAGMVQFKDVFLGKETRPYTKAASSQRCMRAGGKHNDLERVGYTARHHTFFEMLGNFSFGAYFKREAILLAWEFLTSVLKLPQEKLWITVYEQDEEAANIWLQEMKINPKRFSRLKEDSNFWSMGIKGPCGPCTEIFYDHGATIFGGPPGSEDEDGDRFVEIWNLVFMEYDKLEDGTLIPLPIKAVDTGMGLERITAVMQGVHNNYDTDLFLGLIKKIAQLANTNDFTHTSLRVIADHIRSCAFLIADGITPSNEGRGYVLRRIIRRAIRHGRQLGIKETFFYQLVAPLAQEMGAFYEELANKQLQIEEILLREEEQFNTTLIQGLKLLDDVLITKEIKSVIPGELVFKLYDTYGFPADLTNDIAREKGLSLDVEGFEKAMQKQRERSRAHSQFSANQTLSVGNLAPTYFTGYENNHAQKEIQKEIVKSNIIALYNNENLVNKLSTGEEGILVLDRTPFYAESGGQVGDQGEIQGTNQAIFIVTDTKKQGQLFFHKGSVKQGELAVNLPVIAKVDLLRRNDIMRNHTATHLLHMVLKKVLGQHAEQKGSLVERERLRFDFSHTTALTTEQIKEIEQQVNKEIIANHHALIKVTSYEEAIKEGAIGLFENKYDEKVRVIRFGESLELCGGTHTHATGEIGLFKITNELGIARGIRRIEAVTGTHALTFIEKTIKMLEKTLQERDEMLREKDKQLMQLKNKLANTIMNDLMKETHLINNTHVLVKTLTNTDNKTLRIMVDELKKQLQKAVIILVGIEKEKVMLVAGVSDALTTKIKAGELIKRLTNELHGKGGGRADLAEGGGVYSENLKHILLKITAFIDETLMKN